MGAEEDYQAVMEDNREAEEEIARLEKRIEVLEARLRDSDQEYEQLLSMNVRLTGELTQANLRLARYDGGAARA